LDSSSFFLRIIIIFFHHPDWAISSKIADIFLRFFSELLCHGRESLRYSKAILVETNPILEMHVLVEIVGH
jgi:hypothetical protein